MIGLSSRRRISKRSGVVGIFALAAVAVAAGSLASVGCHAQRKSQPPPVARSARSRSRRIERPQADEIGWLTIRLENPPPASVMDVKPENLPAYVASLYRIRPDRRFLYAVAELTRLTAGGLRRGVMAIRFEEGRWHLTLDGSPIGDLPEFPSFADARSLLLAQVRAQTGSKRAAAAKGTPAAASLTVADTSALDSGPPEALLPVLARLNAGWTASPGDPALTEASVRGLLWLALQTFDQLELSDPILGKALALFAIAESARPGRLVHEECLLASLLGYEDHARSRARSFRRTIR